jgi:FtsP/CotA-like multicopper oxidase with cupredoxin domain/plastocyanin
MTTVVPRPSSTEAPTRIGNGLPPGPPGDPEADRRRMMTGFAVLTSLVAFCVAVAGIIVVSTADIGSGPATAGPAEVAVTLTELKISPAALTAAAGPVTLKIANQGSMVHNVSVPALGKKSADIAAGKSATLDLGTVAAGTYEVLCEIPGHADGGMKGTLTVTAGAASGPASGSASDSMAGMDHSGGDMDWAAMDARMAKGMAAGLETFVKGGSTKGVGNQKLVPTVEPDGTKVFQLTSSIVDWEVSAGRTVKAWAYNGMVPGPWIRTEPGDKVKVVIQNRLPVSTDIHFHGITTPFDMDGVAPLTQPAIKAGETFTYQWTNVEHPELGMYHAHDHGQTAVLNGMFAVFQVGDVALPAGQRINAVQVPNISKATYEEVMVLNDAGVIGLSLNGKSFPATAPLTMKPGETMLMHYYNEGLQAHPMHLHHVPHIVVAKDGFPLAQPYMADTINVAPGERYSILVLPTTNDLGVWAWHCHILTHAENDDGLFGMVTALIVDDKPKAG